MSFDYLKYKLPMRRRRQSLGLRVDGLPRSSRWERRPLLAGLDRAEYQKQYMQMVRARENP